MVYLAIVIFWTDLDSEGLTQPRMDTQGGKNRNIEATSSSEVGTHFLDIVPGDLNYCY